MHDQDRYSQEVRRQVINQAIWTAKSPERIAVENGVRVEDVIEWKYQALQAHRELIEDERKTREAEKKRKPRKARKTRKPLKDYAHASDKEINREKAELIRENAELARERVELARKIEWMKERYRLMGLDPDAIIREDRSRNAPSDT